jgi:protein involved in polysaccharide export with SLBB domain
VVAAGITPLELSKKLKKAYKGQLRNPEIAVIVRSLASQVYVDGEVGQPGMLALEGPTTVMQSIASAGGFTDRSKLKEVIVIRRRPNKTVVITANLDDVIRGKDTRQDINLLPSDIVYVPRTPIANINIWVDQYIRRNVPLPFFSFK